MSSHFIYGRRPYAVATPTAPVPVAGNDIVVDGNMEAADATAWPTYTAALTREKSTDNPYAEAQSLHVAAADAYQGASQLMTLDANSWYQLTAAVRAVSGSPQIHWAINGLGVGLAGGTSGADWLPIIATNLEIAGAARRVFVFSIAAFDGFFDSIVVKKLALANLISARLYASADCDISVAITRLDNTQAGLVGRLDSAVTPANFVLATLQKDTGGNVAVILYKCVAGTYSVLFTALVTYGAAKVLRLRCSGTSVAVYYDGTQVGTTQTVSDAGIIGNLYHGLFSTYAANTFANYTALSWLTVTP